MKKLIITAATIALLSACSDRSADTDGDGKITNEEAAATMDSVQLEPGEWETVNEIIEANVEGAPGAAGNIAASMKGKKTTSKSCITPEQAKNPSGDFLAMQDEANCEYRKFSMTGGKIDAEMSCKGPAMPGEMTMAMAGDYGPSSYSMNIDAKSAGLPGGMTMNIKTSINGRRVGDCPS